MKISKAIPVAMATVFTLTTAGAGFALAAPPVQGKPQADDAKMQMANYRHHDRGKGRREMHGHGDGMRGIYRLIETFDANGDGSVTQEEIITARQNRLSEFDANKDGSLDLSEYQALWLDAMHERMVDQFQAHDDDGDGLVTIEEFNENFANLVKRRDRNGDGMLNADDAKRPPREGPGRDEDH
jgi:EF hand